MINDFPCHITMSQHDQCLPMPHFIIHSFPPLL